PRLFSTKPSNIKELSAQRGGVLNRLIANAQIASCRLAPARRKSACRYDAEFSPQRPRVPVPGPLRCSSVLPATATQWPLGLRTRRSEEGSVRPAVRVRHGAYAAGHD